ncbi:MAG: cyclic pyranopterin monophosphate synthase MoaC [Candidatus Methanomethylicaceae archaeon]
MSVKMVDISQKDPTVREARASGKISLKEATVALIKKNAIEKGDVLAVSRVAAIQAVKRTSDIIPLCHPILVEHVSVDFDVGDREVSVYVSVRTTAKTGVEMEALAGVSAALLTIWDMTKKYEKDESGQYPTTFIKEIRVVEKRKGLDV